MGTVRPGPSGKFKGKLDNTVFAPWKGINTVRKTPRRTLKKPSIKQLDLRLRFGMSSNFSSKLNDAIKIGFPLNKRNKTNWNFAIQHNVKKAITGTYPDLSIDYAEIQISKGDLAQVCNPRTVVVKGTHSVKITWENPANLKLGVEEHDNLQFCIYGEVDEEEQFAMLNTNAAYRIDGEVTIGINKNFVSIDLWMFLISADKKRTSISRYLGKHSMQDNPETG